MNDAKLIEKVELAVGKLAHGRGYASSVDVLMEIGVLSKSDCEKWRKGSIGCLERACGINLGKLSTINKAIRSCASRRGLAPSFTYYKRWGKGPKTLLRFSKSGNPDIERACATHYVDKRRSPPKNSPAEGTPSEAAAPKEAPSEAAAVKPEPLAPLETTSTGVGEIPRRPQTPPGDLSF